MSTRPPLPRWTAVLAALAFALLPAAPVAAQVGADPGDAFVQERYTEEEIDNLLGPIALYPDALLAQVLIASTFPDQIEEAAQFVRTYGTDGIDEQGWDVSVKAVAHYPPTLNMMAEEIDWTATLGRAYASQSGDVMVGVQRLRTLADVQGNLVSNEQQQVVREDNSYVIVPTQPQVIYVPTYDPYFVYRQPLFRVGFNSPFWSFGVGFPIGSWLIYDFNWGQRNIFYHGWNRSFFAFGGGWRGRAFPFIQVNNFYVNRRYRNVFFNRGVWGRPINVWNLNNRRSVHRGTRFAVRGRDINGQGTARRGGNNGNVGNGRNGNGRNGGNATVQDQNRRSSRLQGATIAASTAATRAERQNRASSAMGRVNANPSTTAQRSATARQATARQATARQAVSRQAVTRQSVNRQPFSRQSSAAQSVTRQSVTRQSVTRQSVTRQSVTRQSVTRQSVTRQSTARSSTARQSVTRQSTARQSTARQATPRATPSRQSTTRQSVTRQSVTRQSTTRRVTPQAAPSRQSTARSSTARSSTARSSTRPSARPSTPQRATARPSAPRRSTPARASAPQRSAPRASAPRRAAPKPAARQSAPRSSAPKKVGRRPGE